MALSALARYMRKNRMLKFGTGAQGRRSMRSPAPEGFTRGAMGTTGSQPFQARDSDAGENRDREEMGLPKTPYSKIMRSG